MYTTVESKFGNTLFVENEGLPKMSKNMNKRATKRKSATENSILKFLTVSSVSSDSIVKGITDIWYPQIDKLFIIVFNEDHWFLI
jgi:hypothetical protein